MFKLFSQKRHVFRTGAGLLAMALGLIVPDAFHPVAATELPPGLVRYLKEKDPAVKIRFDGLILFKNGELYIPVLPTEEQGHRNPEKVLNQDPAKAAYPDLIEFDNHLFLMRLVPTSTGKLTLPRRAEYPLTLRQGLLPQDFLLPSQLSIPSELKILLGSLPYTAPNGEEPNPSSDQLLKAYPDQGRQQPRDPLLLYVADMNRHRILGVEPNTGRTVWETDLNCVARSLQLSPGGDRLYATCLTTDEVVVIDTVANLVATRINLPGKPFDMALMPPFERLVVSNRAKHSLSVVDTRRQLKLNDISVPGAPGALAARQGQSVVFVADAILPRLYEVELASGQLLRTLNDRTHPRKQPENPLGYLSNITDIYLEESPKTLGRLWVISRTQGQLQVIDLLTQQVISQQALGGKPVHFVVGPEHRLYVLCAESDRIEQFDTDTLTRLEPLQLPSGSFPTGLGVDGQGKFAYVATAADEQLLVLDLATGELKQSFPYQSRAIDVALFDQSRVASELEAIEAVRQKQKLTVTAPPAKGKSLKLKDMSIEDVEVEPNSNGLKIRIKEAPAQSGTSSGASVKQPPASPAQADEMQETETKENIKGENTQGKDTKDQVSDEPEAATPAVSADPVALQSAPARRWGWWPFGRRGQP